MSPVNISVNTTNEGYEKDSAISFQARNYNMNGDLSPLEEHWSNKNFIRQWIQETSQF